MGGCCGEASGWAKVGFLLLMCATGLQFAGYLTNNWMTYNTVRDTYDLRVGLWWFTNCSGGAACHTENTPSQYESFEVTLVRWFEGAAGGMFFLCLVLSGFYVATDRCRTRCVAICLLLMTLLAAGLSIAGIVLWVLQVESPYYPAWSMGLSALASSLVLITAMTLIPDIKEYDYESKSTVYPDHTGKYTRLEKSESVRNVSGGPGLPRRPSDIMLTTIGDDTSGYKRSRDLGREYGRPKRQESVGSSRDFNPYPYGPPSSKDAFNREQDRFDLEVITPSAPPRYDFMQRKF